MTQKARPGSVGSYRGFVKVIAIILYSQNGNSVDITKLGIYIGYMRVIAKKTINAYRACYPEADGALRAWVSLIESRNFKHFPDLKETFQTADLIQNDRVIFNIKGNHYRLIAAVDFTFHVVFIKWFGKHKDYDKIKPSEVKHEYPPC